MAQSRSLMAASQRLRTESGRAGVVRGDAVGFSTHTVFARFSLLAPPPPAASLPKQPGATPPSALRPLALRLFRFRPALDSSPISICVWVSPPSARRSGSSASSRCCLLPHLLRQAGVFWGPKGCRRQQQQQRYGAWGWWPNYCSRTRVRVLEHSAAPGAGAEAGTREAVRGGEERTPEAPQEVPGR